MAFLLTSDSEYGGSDGSERYQFPIPGRTGLDFLSAITLCVNKIPPFLIVPTLARTGRKTCNGLGVFWCFVGGGDIRDVLT